RTCAVCNDSKPLDDFPLQPTARCAHQPNTCHICLQTWISSSLESKGFDRITCSECDGKLEYDDILNLASPETFHRYDALLTRALLSTFPAFRWCRNAACSSGQLHTGSATANSIFRCSACGHSYCINHGAESPSHPEESCAQYEDRAHRTLENIEAEMESEKLIKEVAKRCPGPKCGWWIEKNDGCDHMTCSRCRWEFCWACMAPYDPIRRMGNHMHREDCKYY
ncbi:hypothetical protein K432DRAFT_255370, partial [Lepidopterella palustris CBS 459.81]